MEKAISAEERIRRAEEIYARRKNANMGTSTPYARVNVGEKKKYRPLRKMFVQLCICVVIYISFYAVKNGEYMFSGDFTNNIKNILEYDISFQSISSDVVNYINQIKNKDANIPKENIENAGNVVNAENIDNAINTESTESNNEQSINEINSTETYEEGITEGVTETMQTDTLGVIDEPLYTTETSSISQMEIDASYIKENYSIIKPLNGTITSRFGNRNPTVKTVPKYHTGIDIAANTGTKIIAAMEGEVILVSSQGDYRKTCENSKWRCNHTICSLQ